MPATSGRLPDPLQWVIILLIAATALMHIYLAFQLPGGVDSVFLLNGLGYLILAILIYAPIAALARYRNILRWVLIAYAAITVLAWLFIGARSMFAYVDKAIEIALIVLLWFDWQRQRGGRSVA